MSKQESRTERPSPKDFVYVSKIGEYTVAQRNVFAVAGHRAEALMHTFVSSNTTTTEKTRAAHRFLAMTGVHPQAIQDEVKRINSVWLASGVNPLTKYL